ncbi:MAG: hypothetical protein NTW69_00490 [Chloroflexi bacterium]|nr:hypothetical protein [Chloroflexota bacterium]
MMGNILLFLYAPIKLWTKTCYSKKETNKGELYLFACDWCVFLKTIIQMIPASIQKINRAQLEKKGNPLIEISAKSPKNQADEPRTSTRGKSNNFDFEPVSNLIQDNKSREFRLSAFIMEAMIF